MKKRWGFILAALMAMVFMVMGGCGGGGDGGGGGSSSESGGGNNSGATGTVSNQTVSSPSNSYFPTDAVNSSNQPVSVNWKYVLSGSQTVTSAKGVNYTLQNYEMAYDPATNKFTETYTVSGSGNGVSATRTDSGNMQLISLNGNKYVKEGVKTSSGQGTVNGNSVAGLGSSVITTFESPYLEYFIMRSSLGSLSTGYSTTISASGTIKFIDSRGATTTQSGQSTSKWTIANKYPSMAVQGVTYNDVIEIKQEEISYDITPRTITVWLAKGIGIIKAINWDDYMMNGTNYLPIELKSTNLTAK